MERLEVSDTRMNHYPHHIGDFVKDTLGFSQGAIGAYRLLMDAYYADEAAPAARDVYVIGRATTPAERRNVDKALEKFELRDGRYHHKRVEEELVSYRSRVDSARENGGKGGRPKKPTDNPRDNPRRTEQLTEPITHGEPSEKLASSHKPINPNPQAAPLVSETTASAGARCAAVLQNLKDKPPTLDEARISSNDATPAGILSAICTANGISPSTPFHPLIVEWAREGFTVDRVKHAIAVARERKPAPQKIPPAYLDTILRDESKPAAQRQAEKVTENAAKNVEKASRILAEQREAATRATPMPEHLRPKVGP